MTKRILLMVSSADSIGPKNRKTGNFLPKVSHPYSAFVKQGYEVDFASVKGGAAPLDGADLLDDPMNKSFMEGAGAKSFATTREISTVDTQPCDAIFVPGGLSPMADMPEGERSEVYFGSRLAAQQHCRWKVGHRTKSYFCVRRSRENDRHPGKLILTHHQQVVVSGANTLDLSELGRVIPGQG